MRDALLLFSAETKRKLVLALGGSLFVAALEMAGLLAILPLMQLLQGSSTSSGVLGRLSSLLGSPSDGTLGVVLASIVFGAFLFKSIFTVAFRWWMLGFLNEQEATTATELLQRYLSAPYWLHLQRNTAELVRNMNDAVSQAYGNVVVGAISGLTEIATIAGIAVILVALQPLPAFAAIAYFCAAGYAFHRFVRNRTLEAGRSMADSSFEAYRASFHALGGVKEIKVRRNAPYFVADYERARRRFAAAKRRSGFLTDLPRYVLEMVFIVGVAIMTAIVFAMETSDDAVAVLALFIAAGFRMLPSLVRGLASTNAMRIGRRGLELVLADLKDVADGDCPDSDPPHRLSLDSEITLDGVSFRYPSTDLGVLHDVSLQIPAASSVAIVGSSGAGKSTLVDLVLGLHQPTQGSICVDGKEINRVLPEWQRSIGIVPQDVYLLDDSLRANVAFGEDRETISDERLAEAIDLAQLGELVNSLPQGLDTFVGDRGVRLSGGQRQRIGIARALYLQPQLLVLDEATSALDNETERRITSTIDSLRGRLTIIVVAHRLSTVRNCDRLIFLQDGVIGGCGTFEEVRTSNEEFAALVELGNLNRPLRETVEGAASPAPVP